MSQEDFASTLIQQVCDSIKTLSQLQKTLTQLGVSLNADPRFAALLADLRMTSPTDSSQTTPPGERPGVILPVIDNNSHPLLQLRAAVRDGSAQEQFPVGTIISDQWTNLKDHKTYEMPLRIVDYRKVRRAKDDILCLAAILQRINATPETIQFDEHSHYFYKPAARLPSGRMSDERESNIMSWLNGPYYNGCSPALRQAMCLIILPDEGWGAKTHFFLPRPEALHVSLRGVVAPHIRPNPYDPPCYPYEDSKPEKHAWEYFRATSTDPKIPCEERVFLDPDGIAQPCWLTLAIENIWRVWVVDKDGTIRRANATEALACAPVCAIC